MAQRQIPGGAFIDDTGLWDRQIPGSSFVNETQFPEQGPVTSGVSLLLPVEDSIRARKSNLNITGGYPWRVFYTPEGIPGFAPWTRGTAGTLVAGQLGRALNMTGVTTSNGATCAIPGIAGSTRFTGFAIFRKNSAAGAGAGLIRDYNGGNGWSVAFSGGNGDQLRLEAANVATISSVTVGNDLFAYVGSVGPSYSYTGLLNLRTGTLVESIGSTGAASSNPTGSAVVLSISVTNNLDGELYSAGYGYFSLTQASGRALLNRARSLFVDISPRIWIPASQVSKTVRTTQPEITTAQINKANPITVGLRFLWLPGNTVTGQAVSSEVGKTDVYTTSGKASHWSRVAGGGLTFSDMLVTDTATSSISVLYVGAPTASTNRLGIVAQRALTGIAEGFNLCVNTTDGLSPEAGRIRLTSNRSSSNDTVAVAAPYSRVDGRVHAWVASKTVNVSNGEIWCDGASLPVATNSINPILPIVSAGQASSVGTLAGDNAFVNNTPTYLVAVWDRKLTSKECRDLSANPWQIFADEGKPVEPVKSPRNTQPQEDIAYTPAWRDIALTPLIASMPSRTIDGQAVTVVGTRTVVTDKLGQVWNHSAGLNLSRAIIRGSTIGALEGSGGAVLGLFRHTGTALGSPIFGLGSDQGSAGNTMFLFMTGTTNAKDAYMSVGNSVEHVTREVTANLNDGQWHCVMIGNAGFSGSVAGQVDLWIDGIYYGKGAALPQISGFGNIFNHVVANAFRRGGVDNGGIGGDVALVVPFNRCPTPQEGIDLTSNPWQLFVNRPKDSVSPKQNRVDTVQQSRNLLFGSSEPKRTSALVYAPRVAKPYISSTQQATGPSSPIHLWWVGSGNGRMRLYGAGRNKIPAILLPASTGSEPSGCRFVGGPLGYHLLCDDTGTGVYTSKTMSLGDASGSGSPLNVPFSVVARLTYAGEAFGGSIYGSNTSGSMNIRFNGNKIQLLKANTAIIGSSTTNLVVGNTYDIGVEYDGTTVRFYLDGRPDGSAVNAQTFVYAAQYYIGRCFSTEAWSNGTRFYRMAVFDRCIGAAAFAGLAGEGFWRLLPSHQDPIVTAI